MMFLTDLKKEEGSMFHYMYFLWEEPKTTILNITRKEIAEVERKQK